MFLHILGDSKGLHRLPGKRDQILALAFSGEELKGNFSKKICSQGFGVTKTDALNHNPSPPGTRSVKLLFLRNKLGNSIKLHKLKVLSVVYMVPFLGHSGLK